MSYKIFISIICNVLFFQCIAQTPAISPSQSTEQCPNVNILFTASVPGTNPIISPKALNANPILVQQAYNKVTSGGSTIFNFVGQFSDQNNKQTFYVNYTDANGIGVGYDFTFTKIKSLRFANYSSQIFPVPTGITAERCKVQSFSISFPNVQYGNPFEITQSAYGSITNYQYLLPLGWKLNNTTDSDGVTWLSGTNSATVTSDLTHGTAAGSGISIRPVNTACGAGLQPGQEAFVSISRPAPTLTISPNGNQAFICSGTKNFTVSGLPIGATVSSWSSSDPLLATVPAGFTGTTVPVTKTGSDGSVVITANVTDCITTYPVSLTVNLGTNVPAVYSISSNYIATNSNQFQYFTNPPQGIGYAYQPANKNVQFTPYITTTFLTSPANWSVSGTYSLFYPYSNSASLYMTTPNSGSYTRNIANVRLQANSSCGIVDKLYVFQAVVTSSSYRLKASPNPVKGNIKLSIEKVQEENMAATRQFELPKSNLAISKKTVFQLFDINTNSLIKEWSFGEVAFTKYNLSVSGVKSGWYILKMDRESKLTTTKIFIQ